jgi:hypothetical protein
MSSASRGGDGNSHPPLAPCAEGMHSGCHCLWTAAPLVASVTGGPLLGPACLLLLGAGYSAVSPPLKAVVMTDYLLLPVVMVVVAVSP